MGGPLVYWTVQKFFLQNFQGVQFSWAGHHKYLPDQKNSQATSTIIIHIQRSAKIQLLKKTIQVYTRTCV